MIISYRIVSLEERYDLFERQDKICEEVWPEFMLHDTVANTCWMKFVEAFKKFQLLLMDKNEILAVINTVPLHYDESINELPDEGWDWGVLKSLTDYETGKQPNILMGVQIVVNKNHQGKGLSSHAVREMSDLAGRNGFNKLVLPVRPSEKHKYPLISMEDYIQWEDENGLPFDNWLRVHIKAGGHIVKICSEAMRIPGTVDEWKEWTKLDFPGSGSYIVPGALNPVSIDIESNEGIYVEPNVWILHKTESGSKR